MNIPNALSIFRILLVPVFVWLFFSDTPGAHLYAGGVMALAYFTDALDGFIARRFNMITKLGKILDPLADKMMTITSLTCVTVAKLIPVWIVIVFAAKELIMGAGAALLYRKTEDVMPSQMVGKFATGFFFISILVLLLFSPSYLMSTILLTIALGLTIAALIYYACVYMTLMARNKQG